VLAGIPSGSYFYFVHSYRLPVVPETIASCAYEETFSAAVASSNCIGVQFHPEKSAANGEKLLKNFLRWSV
jgi:glutamine amidotransferase